MRTVLMIDDDPEYREVMAELLEQHGWHVLSAADGDSGILMAREHHPDIILCDLLMPRCNGFQVCRSLRAERLPHTKILVTSARDFGSDRQEAFEAGADQYLTKPIELSRLLPMLEKLTQRPALHQPVPVVPAESETGRIWVKFWGVRGSIPTPGPSTVIYGGNTSCVEVRAGAQIIILDAGTGLRQLGRQLLSEFGEQPLDLTLLLTHTHWDHIQGLPFFQPVYKQNNHLRILGYEGARNGLQSVLSSQMESSFFPIGLREVPANVQIDELKEMEFCVGPVRVQTCYANHPGICVGYRLFTSRGSIAFFPDNESFQGQHRSASNSDANAQSVQQFARNQDQRIADFLRETDVLIIDSQYDDSEYQSHIGWGHGCLRDVVNLAMQAEVKQLVLFHHDPDHDDEKVTQMVEVARQLVLTRQGTLTVQAAREGLTIEL